MTIINGVSITENTKNEVLAYKFNERGRGVVKGFKIGTFLDDIEIDVDRLRIHVWVFFKVKHHTVRHSERSTGHGSLVSAAVLRTCFGQKSRNR